MAKTARNEVLKFMEWVVMTLCGLHIVSNALKWSCYFFLREIRADMKQIFGLASSLRASFDIIDEGFAKFASSWVARDVQRDDEGDRQWWSSFGSHPSPVWLAWESPWSGSQL